MSRLPDATTNYYPVQAPYEIPNIMAPKLLEMECSNCGKWWTVRGIRHFDTWMYQMVCPDCNLRFVNLKPIRTLCPVCGDITTVTDGNKFGACKSCKKGPPPRPQHPEPLEE
jgi:hypothetical protein